jgi:TonB family protein
MKPICSELQERLAEEGAQALRSDAAAQRHLEECPDCFRVLEQLARLDTAFAAMPAHDAADRVVAEVLGRVKADAVPPRAEATPLPFAPTPTGARAWVWALGSAASLVVVGAFITTTLMYRSDPEPVQMQATRALEFSDTTGGNRAGLPKPSATPPTTLVPAPASADDKVVAEGKTTVHGLDIEVSRNGRLSNEEFEKLKALGYVDPAQRRGASPGSDVNASPAAPNKPGPKDGEVSTTTLARDEVAGVEGGMLGGVPGSVVGGVVGGTGGKVGQPPLRVGGNIKAPKRIRGGVPAYPQLAFGARAEGVVILEVVIDATGKVGNVRVVRGVPALDAFAVEAVKQWVYEPTVVSGVAVPVVTTVTVSFRLAETPKPEPDPQGAADPATVFLEERSSTEAVFQPARGYWSNTYLPGDPVLRLLRARLRGSHVRLHEAAVQTMQPFDPPAQSGLALHVSADRRALDKPSRMLLQVGLTGAPRSAGHRPPMSVALVFDLRGERDAETVADMRALALAFAEAREAGDRFSLVVAGPHGGVIVPRDKFKHGAVAVAFQQLMAGDPIVAGAAVDLPGALAAALLEAGQCDEPDAALGGSAVVLVTAQLLGEAIAAVEDLAHLGAVAGVPTSVVSVGRGASPAELDRVALAGQGSRRSLETRADAPRIAEAELVAASDVVARAVRLRIRLSPRVRLVEVVGSRRLDEAQAQRVREAERSVDLRLSRLLGIESDRGQDEDGIQIVIPSFHAGDDHVVLLDVVAEGPGALADVSVRYKDVAFLRNGTARASLELASGSAVAGPIERNVLKNLLAIRLAQGFAEAGAALDAGDAALASALVGRASALRSGLLARAPGLAGDRELSRDVALLQEYSRALAGAGAASRELADSLRYAGRLKQLPRSASRTNIL